MIGVEGIVGGSMMGALYEDVENFFGDIFAWYGRQVARLPWLFVIIPLLVCGLLGLGLFGITYETDIEVLYTPIGSQSFEDRAGMKEVFPDVTGERFYARQQITQPTYGEVIIALTNTDDPNHGACVGDILSPTATKEILKLHDFILNITVTDPDSTDIYQYKDICAVRDEQCVVEGLNLVDDEYTSRSRRSYEAPANDQRSRRSYEAPANDQRSRRLYEAPANDQRSRRSYGTPANDQRSRRSFGAPSDDQRSRRSYGRDLGHPELVERDDLHSSEGSMDDSKSLDEIYHSMLDLPVLSGYHTDGDNRTCPGVLRLRYNLLYNGTDQRDRGLCWERNFITALRMYHSDVIDISYTVSESLDFELRDHVHTDTRLLGFSVLAMVIFATIIGSGVNCVTNHVALAYAGVFAALLAILGALGLLSLMGLRFVNLSGVMPFLVLGIGADDMFQLMTEWRQSNVRDSIEDRMASTMRSTAVSITITSLTDLIAFCIGATSPFVSIRHFCACSGVAILLCYVNQLTFYGGCIVLHARRVEASRHWFTCWPTKSREEMEEERAHPLKVLLCSGNPPRRVGEEGGVCRKMSRLFYTYYPRFLLHWATKAAVFVLFICYIAVSFWGATHIERGLKLEWVVPDESYLSKYLRMDYKYFPDNGPIITFIVRGPHRYTLNTVFYHEKCTQDDIAFVLSEAEKSATTVNGSMISWLHHYIAYRNYHNLSEPRNEKDFINDLVDHFLPRYPSYKDDVKFNADLSLIVACRFYVVTRKLQNSEAEGEMMLRMRRVSNTSPLHVTAYSPNFLYYEQYVSILKNTFLPVGVTMIGLLFVALVFIPHPIAVTCVTMAMISIVVGMVGLMRLWGLTLSAITVIQVIMSLGICMSFTVHMSHSFMTATGKNRNERVTVAIEKVGIPILNGALSSLFCAVMLSFGSSFIFISFFKTMILVFFLGILHSLVFLPVMLSFIGPRRTRKPRVFIPVSPSSRSLQDSYWTNSLPFHGPSDTGLEGKANTTSKLNGKGTTCTDNTLDSPRGSPASRLTARPDTTLDSSRCSPASRRTAQTDNTLDTSRGSPAARRTAQTDNTLDAPRDSPEPRTTLARELCTIEEYANPDDVRTSVDDVSTSIDNAEELDYDNKRKVSFAIGNSPVVSSGYAGKDADIEANSALETTGNRAESHINRNRDATQGKDGTAMSQGKDTHT